MNIKFYKARHSSISRLLSQNKLIAEKTADPGMLLLNIQGI